jgi:hypothetical protein
MILVLKKKSKTPNPLEGVPPSLAAPIPAAVLLVFSRPRGHSFYSGAGGSVYLARPSLAHLRFVLVDPLHLHPL